MKKIGYLIFLMPFMGMSQTNSQIKDILEKGIRFEKNENWQQIMDKAKAENKYILVDCYASWCGPCKRMDNYIFNNDSVGQYVNGHFLSVRAQMDTTKNDNSAIQAWYSDAHDFRERYKVSAFPTFLFFDPNGQLVHRGIGYHKGSEFIELAEQAMDSNKQYYTLLNAYQSGERNYLEMPVLVDYAQSFGETKLAEAIAAEYLKDYLEKLNCAELCTKPNLDFLGDNLQMLKSNEGVFKCIFNHQKIVDSVEKDSGYAAWLVNCVVNNELIGPAIQIAKLDSVEPDWAGISRQIKRQFGAIYVDKNLIKAQVNYYRLIKNWKKYTRYLVRKMDMEDLPKITRSLSNMDALNNCAWDIFQHSEKKAELLKAITWSNCALQMSTKPMNDYGNYLDTKANLLYKLGNTNEAIALERKALEFTPQSKEITLDLLKMEDGSPTW